MPRIRQVPEDFQVDEVPLYSPEGRGDHTLLRIEKRGVDTEDVLAQLACGLSLSSQSLGYAGRKDRWAVTRQWVSVPGVDPGRARRLDGPGWRVIEAARHPHRLRPGDLHGNRFRIVVRDLEAGSTQQLRERVRQIRKRGLVNRFGRQRFGRDGRNAELGAALLRGRRVRGSRRHRRFLLAALQASLFNEFLERRPASAGEVLVGDLVIRHASGGLAPVTDPAAERDRLDALEISPTGPLYGPKMRPTAGTVGELEEVLWREQGFPDWRRLGTVAGVRVWGGRRALRVGVTDLELEIDEGEPGGVAVVTFTLPPGSYATVLIQALFPGAQVREGGGT